MDFDSAASRSRPALNHEIFKSWNGKQIHLRDEEDSSKAAEYSPHRNNYRSLSPSSTAEEYGFGSSPQRNNYRSLSPSSKAVAIATGQKELMEIVRNMPECCYELSLKDLVEQQRDETVPDVRVSNREMVNRRSRKETRPRLENNGDLYLKVGFPKSIGTKTTKTKTKKMDCNLNMNSKVSPKPAMAVEKDWLKRTGSVVNNGSIKSSSSSNGSHGSTMSITKTSGSHGSSGCWSCIYPKYKEGDE